MKMSTTDKIIECIPNFSEGQKKEVVNAIADAISQTPGCSLLDVDDGPSTNRTVYTFIGSPEAVVEGALRAARQAYKLIDMSVHKGEHPRLGAMDVCPFIPVRNATMDDCIKCAETVGQKLAEELQVPVYLYGEAARTPKRKLLSTIRTGEYEGLADKIKDPDWQPDFGPANFVKSWGGTVIGARKYLIAFNVNLLSTKEQAHRIALNVREQGRKDQPGRLKKVQGIGWYLKECNMAQVSLNLLDYEVTPLHVVFEEIKKDAKELKLPVVGSQIVGLVPLQSFLMTADFYIQKEELFIIDEDQKINLVIDRLGLNSIDVFNPRKRIIEYMLGESNTPLLDMTVNSFIDNVGSRSPAPGGGSVAALCASLGAALGAMVGQLTYGKRQFAELDGKMRKLIPPLHEKMLELKKFIDADSKAFETYMAALKMTNATEKEKAQKEIAKKNAMINAVKVPLTVAQLISELWSTLEEMAKYGNINCKSDIQTGVRLLEAATWGAYYNVMINLNSVKDEPLKSNFMDDMNKFKQLMVASSSKILQIIDERES